MLSRSSWWKGDPFTKIAKWVFFMFKHTDRRILTLKAKFSREGRLRRVGGRSDRKWWDLGGSHHRQTSHQFWSEIHNRIHWIYTGYNRMHCPCCVSQLHLSEYMHYGVPSFKKLGFYLEACISLQKYCRSILFFYYFGWVARMELWPDKASRVPTLITRPPPGLTFPYAR